MKEVFKVASSSAADRPMYFTREVYDTSSTTHHEIADYLFNRWDTVLQKLSDVEQP